MRKRMTLLLVAVLALSMTACAGMGTSDVSKADDYPAGYDPWKPVDLDLPGINEQPSEISSDITVAEPSSSGTEQTGGKPSAGSEQTSEKPSAGSDKTSEKPSAGSDKTSETPKESEAPAAKTWENTKTGKFYGQFADGTMYMKLSTKQDGEDVALVMAVKGDKVYIKTDAGKKGSVIVIRDKYYYYLMDPAEKIALKMKTEKVEQGVEGMVMDESKADMETMVKGKRTISGKKYDTEEWVTGKTKVIMCFSGEKAVYMISQEGKQETVIKIEEYSSKVQDSLFRVPSDYEIVSMK